MVLKMYDTWCLSVSSDILNIPDIPKIPDIPEFPLFLRLPTFQTFPIYCHAKSGGPSSKIGWLIAIWKSVQICYEEGAVSAVGKTQLYYLDNHNKGNCMTKNL